MAVENVLTAAPATDMASSSSRDSCSAPLAWQRPQLFSKLAKRAAAVGNRLFGGGTDGRNRGRSRAAMLTEKTDA